MPELPEVATYQKFFEQTALHRTVVSVAVHEPRVVLGSPETTERAAWWGNLSLVPETRWQTAFCRAKRRSLAHAALWYDRFAALLPRPGGHPPLC